MHLDPSDEALIGVAVGAFLASLGGLLSGRIEQSLRRREREQSAAQLFGEILAALKLILRMSHDAHGRGDPFGPITLQILRAAQRETQIYDRNRETLFDLRDVKLRARTHLLLLQISLTVDAILEATKAIHDWMADDDRGIEGQPPRPRITAAVAGRDASFDFLMELREEIPPLLSQYQTIARQSFDAHEDAVQQTLRGPATATA
ncbi:MAG TPA: hypothetical protein VGH86_11765 [Phenylobacterium sp.]|jgi:hypothetical protein